MSKIYKALFTLFTICLLISCSRKSDSVYTDANGIKYWIVEWKLIYIDNAEVFAAHVGASCKAIASENCHISVPEIEAVQDTGKIFVLRYPIFAHSTKYKDFESGDYQSGTDLDGWLFYPSSGKPNIKSVAVRGIVGP